MRARLAAVVEERNALQRALLAACSEAELERDKRRAAEANVRRVVADAAAGRGWIRRLAGLALAQGPDGAVRLVKALSSSAELAELLRRPAA